MKRHPGPNAEVMTQDELVAELRRRFGDDPVAWAFVCPSCGTVTSVADLRAALAEAGRGDEHASTHLGQVCIGRIAGALNREQPEGGYQGPGCDWAAFGLFAGPMWVAIPDEDGGEPNCVPSFRIAGAPAAVTP